MATRKAKAVEVEKKPEKRQAVTPAFIGSVFGSLVVIVVGAVLIGKSDDGQINVNAAIENSNQANIAAGGDASNNVEMVREDLRNLPNGGLVPTDTQPEPTPPPQPTEVATTTEETGTTTEANPSDSEVTAPSEAETETNEAPATQDGE